MSKFTPHYCEGRIPVAFVFSAPGNDEVNFGRPVAGTTGENLDKALACLSMLAPSIFSSSTRYDYRITNAFSEPRAENIGDGRTEAKRSEILTTSNIQRFQKDIAGCHLIVLCGERAQYLLSTLEGKNICVAQAVHIGNKRLNSKFKLLNNWNKLTPTDRRHERIRLWANQLLQDINRICDAPYLIRYDPAVHTDAAQ